MLGSEILCLLAAVKIVMPTWKFLNVLMPLLV
jgi:hypothetical protein